VSSSAARFRIATDAPIVPAPNPGFLRQMYFGDQMPMSENWRPYWGRALDLRQIESAITSANYGLMSRMTDLARETIMLDGHVNALLQKRLNRVAALDWDLVPAAGPDIDEKRSKERTAEVRENLEMIPNFRDRIMDLAWGNFDGRAASELEWFRLGRQWRVRDLHWIHPRRLSFGPDRDLRVIDPQYQTSNFQDVGFAVEAVPYKFVCFKPRLFGDYQEREGLAPRTLYWSFFARLGKREQLELMEIFGKPWRIMIPKQGMPNIAPGGQNRDAYQAGFEALQMLGAANTARMPPGVEVQVVQPEQGAGQVHSDVISDCRDVLTKMYLGGVATTEAVSTGIGSSVANVHFTEEDLIIASDARRIAECLEDQLTDAIIVANYGPSEVVYAPRFRIRTDPPTDRKEEGERIQLGLNAGLRIAEQEARERLGFREVRADEPYLIRFQRPVEPGQTPPPPAAETVWPPGEAPLPGEVPDTPELAINLPDEPALPAPDAEGLPPGSAGPLSLPAPGDVTEASNDVADDDEAAALASRMTELGLERCRHQRTNRCPMCGVERVNSGVELGPDGEAVWPVVWRPIGGRSQPASPTPAAVPAPSPDDAASSRVPGDDDPDDLAVDDGLPSPMEGDDPDDDEDEQESGLIVTRAGRVRAIRSLRLLALAPPAEGGSHWHELKPGEHATAVDGEHTHWFQLPDNTLVETTESGTHQHRYPDDECYYMWGGAHVHSLEMPSGTLATQVDGCHEHQLQGTATTQGGMHAHSLVLPDGATIQSLTARELVEILEGTRDKMPVSYRYRQQRRALLGAYDPSVLFAAQPATVYGSPDDLVDRGTSDFVVQSQALGQDIAKRVDGKTTGKSIRKAIKAAGKAWDRKRFADIIERELMHGLMLGALDADFEMQANERVAVESFSQLHQGLMLLKEGVDTDPAFSKRPQIDAGKEFISKDVVTRDIYDQMSAAAQRRSFTVANAATEEIVRVVQRELVRQIALGSELADFKKHALRRMSDAGWTPINSSHAETVFRTNTMNAYNSGRRRQMTQPAVLAARPYWQVLGVGDGPPRERANHAKTNNKVFRANDPGWKTKYPPFGFNCRHRVRSLSKAQGEAIGISEWSDFDDLPDPGFTSGTSQLV
jgi:phage gp29-like protein